MIHPRLATDTSRWTYSKEMISKKNPNESNIRISKYEILYDNEIIWKDRNTHQILKSLYGGFLPYCQNCVQVLEIHDKKHENKKKSFIGVLFGHWYNLNFLIEKKNKTDKMSRKMKSLIQKLIHIDERFHLQFLKEEYSLNKLKNFSTNHSLKHSKNIGELLKKNEEKLRTFLEKTVEEPNNVNSNQTNIMFAPFVAWEIELPLKRLEQDLITHFSCNLSSSSSLLLEEKDLTYQEMFDLFILLEHTPNEISDLLNFQDQNHLYYIYLKCSLNDKKNENEQKELNDHLYQFFNNKNTIVFIGLIFPISKNVSEPQLQLLSPLCFHFDKRKNTNNYCYSHIDSFYIDLSYCKKNFGQQFSICFFHNNYLNALTFLILYFKSIYLKNSEYHIRNTLNTISKIPNFIFHFSLLCLNLRRLIYNFKMNNNNNNKNKHLNIPKM